MAIALGIPFKAHESFTRSDIDERQELVQSICEVIWVVIKPLVLRLAAR